MVGCGQPASCVRHNSPQLGCHFVVGYGSPATMCHKSPTTPHNTLWWILVSCGKLSSRKNQRGVSLQHVSISGYRLGAVIELPSNAQHWGTAESRAGAAAVWRRNPACEVSILPSGTPLLEKRDIDITWFWSHTKLVFLGDLWKDKASHR